MSQDEQLAEHLARDLRKAERRAEMALYRESVDEMTREELTEEAKLLAGQQRNARRYIRAMTSSLERSELQRQSTVLREKGRVVHARMELMKVTGRAESNRDPLGFRPGFLAGADTSAGVTTEFVNNSVARAFFEQFADKHHDVAVRDLMYSYAVLLGTGPEQDRITVSRGKIFGFTYLLVSDGSVEFYATDSGVYTMGLDLFSLRISASSAWFALHQGTQMTSAALRRRVVPL